MIKVKFNKEEYLERLKNDDNASAYPDIKSVDGGLLIQDLDAGFDNINEMKIVTDTRPTDNEWKDMLLMAGCKKCQIQCYPYCKERSISRSRSGPDEQG